MQGYDRFKQNSIQNICVYTYAFQVCDVEDILYEVSETSVVLSSETNDGTDDLIISLPKREQTSDEVERTHKFGEECVELLRHVPDCRLGMYGFT